MSSSNDTIKTILSHRSIRKFTEQPLTNEQIDIILKASVAGACSSFIQCMSVIRITETAKREKLAELAGNQAYVISAAEFWVFCADFHRHQQISPIAKLGFTEQTLIGAIDCGIAAQNALLAAESMGLGGVYIGGFRNHPLEVAELLNIPKNVMPLFGFCLGHPAQDQKIKPKLPQALFLHENNYQTELDQVALKRYDETVRQYYETRTRHKKSMTWSEQITTILDKEARPFIKDCLNKQGFSTK